MMSILTLEPSLESAVICLGLVTHDGLTPKPLRISGVSSVSDQLQIVDGVFRAALRGVVAGSVGSVQSDLPWYSLAYASPENNTDEQGKAEPAVVLTVALGGDYSSWMVKEVAAVLALIFDQRSVAVIGAGRGTCRMVDRWGRDGDDRNTVLAVDAGARAGSLGLEFPSFDGWPYGCTPSFKRAAERAAEMVAEGHSPEMAVAVVSDAPAVSQVLFVTGLSR